jgi:hypothetical protein
VEKQQSGGKVLYSDNDSEGLSVVWNFGGESVKRTLFLRLEKAKVATQFIPDLHFRIPESPRPVGMAGWD